MGAFHSVSAATELVTNPTSTPQKLNVLMQIPVGALPVLNGRFTHSATIDLQPFRTQTLEYNFYFPAAGEYDHYPVHISRNDKLLAHAEPVRFSDEAVNWAAKAKVLYTAPNFDLKTGLDFFVEHPDYPLFNPLAQVLAFAGAGRVLHFENRLPIQFFAVPSPA